EAQGGRPALPAIARERSSKVPRLDATQGQEAKCSARGSGARGEGRAGGAGVCDSQPPPQARGRPADPQADRALQDEHVVPANMETDEGKQISEIGEARIAGSLVRAHYASPMTLAQSVRKRLYPIVPIQ